jgi:hypothetical protein
MQITKLKPCPFCGKEMDLTCNETLHSSGIAYINTLHGRHYLTVGSARDKGGYYDGLCKVVRCATIYGGCGASISGDSASEVITAWNTRVK